MTQTMHNKIYIERYMNVSQFEDAIGGDVKLAGEYLIVMVDGKWIAFETESFHDEEEMCTAVPDIYDLRKADVITSEEYSIITSERNVDSNRRVEQRERRELARLKAKYERGVV